MVVELSIDIRVENKGSIADHPGKPNTVNMRAGGARQIFFQDPDGYRIEINGVQL